MKNNKVKIILGLFALSLVMFIVTLDSTITNIALPTITDYFQVELGDSNWISTVYVLVMTVFIIPASKFADQFGRKKVMLFGLFLFGFGSVLCGFSHSLEMLIAMRIIQGFGGAIVTPIMIPLSVTLFGKEKAGKAVGIIGAVTAIAAAAGPPVGGLLIKYFNWQSIFYVNVPVVLLTFFLIIYCFNESYDESISKKIDWFGIVSLSIGLFLLTFVLVKGFDYGWTSTKIIWMLIGALLLLGFFFRHEKRTKEPLVAFDLFKEKTFAASAFVYLICGFVIVSSSLVFNFYLQNVKDYSALEASYVIMFMSLTVIISMPLGSKISEKVGFRGLISVGILLMAISLLLLSRLTYDTSKTMMVMEMVLLGFGFGLSCLSLVSAIQYLPDEKSGIGSGITNAARQLGTCLGIALLVGMMTHNVDIAKATIERSGIDIVRSANLSDSLKKIMETDIHDSFDNSNTNNKSDLQQRLKKDIDLAINNKDSSKQLPTPQNSELKKLYEGAEQVEAQFDNNTANETIFSSLQKLHSSLDLLANGFNQYGSGVIEVYFQMIKNDPYASQHLETYNQQLGRIINTDESDEKIIFLENMVMLYTAGTDAAVTTSEQFYQKIQELMTIENSNNIMILEKKIKEGVIQLQNGVTLFQKQFENEGTFKESISSLREGIGMMGQLTEIKLISNQIKDLKNEKIVEAFTKTFLVAAGIVFISVIAGWFTDKNKIAQ